MVHGEMRVTTNSGDAGQGRSYEAHVLAYASVGDLSGPQHKKAVNPCMLFFVAAEEEARAVMENLRLGRRAKLLRKSGFSDFATEIEFPRDMGYDFHPTLIANVSGALAYYVTRSRLFEFQPGMTDGEGGIRFVVMPALQDIEEVLRERDGDVAAALGHLHDLGYRQDNAAHQERARRRGWEPNPARSEDDDCVWVPAEIQLDRALVGLSVIWAAHLHERCELPIPQHMSFRAQLFLRALGHGIASFPSQDTGRGGWPSKWGHAASFLSLVSSVPMHHGVYTGLTHKALADFLVEEIKSFERVRGVAHGAR